MTDYVWPADLVPSTSALSWLDNTTRFVSPFTGTVRRYRRPGGRWRMTMSFNALEPDKAQQLEAFLWRLDGMSHTAVIPDFGYRRQSTSGGSPVVAGGGQTGRTLLTTGWTGSLVMKAGDRFTLGNQMLVVAADAYASDGDDYLLTEDGEILLTEGGDPILVESGNCQLLLTSVLRSSPANGAALNVTSPTARYLLVNRPESSAVPGVIRSVSCEFEEAID